MLLFFEKEEKCGPGDPRTENNHEHNDVKS